MPEAQPLPPFLPGASRKHDITVASMHLVILNLIVSSPASVCHFVMKVTRLLQSKAEVVEETAAAFPSGGAATVSSSCENPEMCRRHRASKASGGGSKRRATLFSKQSIYEESCIYAAAACLRLTSSRAENGLQ